MIHLRLACGHKEAEACVCASVHLSVIHFFSFFADFSVCLIAAAFTLPLYRWFHLRNLRVCNASESPEWHYVITQQIRLITRMHRYSVVKGETLTDRCFCSSHVSLTAGFKASFFISIALVMFYRRTSINLEVLAGGKSHYFQDDLSSSF